MDDHQKSTSKQAHSDFDAAAAAIILVQGKIPRHQTRFTRNVSLLSAPLLSLPAYRERERENEREMFCLCDINFSGRLCINGLFVVGPEFINGVSERRG